MISGSGGRWWTGFLGSSGEGSYFRKASQRRDADHGAGDSDTRPGQGSPADTRPMRAGDGGPDVMRVNSLFEGPLTTSFEGAAPFLSWRIPWRSLRIACDGRLRPVREPARPARSRYTFGGAPRSAGS